MAFTVSDFDDLVKLLGQHPEWQAELRRLLVGDQLAAIGARLEALVTAQERSEARLDALTQAQERTEASLRALTERMDQFAADTASRLGILETHVGDLRGWQIEFRLERRIPGYFGAILRKPRAVSPFTLPVVESAYDEGRISDADWVSLVPWTSSSKADGPSILLPCNRGVRGRGSDQCPASE
jgi:hypothetical protein